MPYGGLNPSPEQSGGPGDRRLERILESLNAARGDGYDVSSSSNVYVENMALARAISAAWGTNRRIAHEWDPNKTVAFIPRWEAIMGLRPNPSDTAVERRARIAAQWARFGQRVDRQYISDGLTRLLGSVFVSVEYISFANAVIHTPDGTYPWGTASTDTPWYSTVAHVLIRVSKPTNYTEGDFQKVVSTIHPFMDAVCPAWMTWDWYRPGAVSYEVSGGPSAGGFFLDEDHNLNNQVFDV